jgi:hypothetical protein
MHQLVIISFFDWEKKKKKEHSGNHKRKGGKKKKKKTRSDVFSFRKDFSCTIFSYVRIHTCNIYTYYIIIILPSCCNVEEKKILSIVHHVFFSLGSFLASGVRFLLNFIEVR